MKFHDLISISVARNEQEDGRLRRLQARDIRTDQVDEHER